MRDLPRDDDMDYFDEGSSDEVGFDSDEEDDE